MTRQTLTLRAPGFPPKQATIISVQGKALWVSVSGWPEIKIDSDGRCYAGRKCLDWRADPELIARILEGGE